MGIWNRIKEFNTVPLQQVGSRSAPTSSLCFMLCIVAVFQQKLASVLLVQVTRFMQMSKIWNRKLQHEKSKMHFHKIFVKYSYRNSWVGITEREVSSDKEEAEWKRVWTEKLKLGLLLTEQVIWNDSLGDFSKAGQKIWVSSQTKNAFQRLIGSLNNDQTSFNSAMKYGVDFSQVYLFMNANILMSFLHLSGAPVELKSWRSLVWELLLRTMVLPSTAWHFSWWKINSLRIMTPDTQLNVRWTQISCFEELWNLYVKENFMHRLPGGKGKWISLSAFVLSMLIYPKEQFIMKWHFWRTQREGFRQAFRIQ